MRIAGTDEFFKLWGRIFTDRPQSKALRLTIQSRMPAHLAGARKAFVLSTTSWVGGRNTVRRGAMCFSH